jgi:hypothetical protein
MSVAKADATRKRGEYADSVPPGSGPAIDGWEGRPVHTHGVGSEVAPDAERGPSAAAPRRAGGAGARA